MSPLPRKPGRRLQGAGRPAPSSGDPGAWIAASALAAGIVGACLAVDTAAESAFDAPKRLVVLVAIAAASGALLALPPAASGRRWWSWRLGTTAQRVALVALSSALALAVVAAVLSPRRGASLDTARVIVLSALLVPLGASRALAGTRAQVVLGAFVGACVVNASVSLLQFWGGLRLFRVETVGGRLEVSAFVGNDGVLALSLALAGVTCLALALSAPSRAARAAWAGGVALLLVALAVTQNLTAVAALVSGSTVLVALTVRGRVLVGALAVVAVVVGTLTIHPGLSRRVQETVELVRSGDWDPVVTYRLGPWAAAVEMARTRPLIGWGPGTFGAEFVPHRLQAEFRFHRRFVNPFLAGSYAEAHSEYLQAAAEAGIPAAAAALVALVTLIVGLVSKVRLIADGPSRREAMVALVLLCAGGAAALTWFPLQRPITAVPLLLAAGRAWRLLGIDGTGDAA
jgi:hypothetical protein